MHIIHLLRSSTKVRGWKNKGRGIGCTSTWERNRDRFQKRITSSFGQNWSKLWIAHTNGSSSSPCATFQRSLIHGATTQHNRIEKSWLGWDNPPPLLPMGLLFGLLGLQYLFQKWRLSKCLWLCFVRVHRSYLWTSFDNFKALYIPQGREADFKIVYHICNSFPYMK